MRSDRERQAREFAESVQNVLNATICTGIRISVASSIDTRSVSIGHGLSAVCDKGKHLTPDTLFPLAQASLAHAGRTLHTCRGIKVEVVGIRPAS
jgi:hypothetical protein